MNVGKKMAVPAGILLAVSLLVTSLCTVFLISYYDRAHFQMMGEIYQEIIESQPEAEQIIFSVLKNDLHRSKPLMGAPAEENILYAYGYRQSDFQPAASRMVAIFAAAGALAGGMIFLFIFFSWHKKEIERVKNLTEYLEKINTGGSGELMQTGEDEYVKLQDEIYKTVTELYQTRDAALEAKKNFAENLYNIAHQLKTPITSISLSMQMMQETPSLHQMEQVRAQLLRLNALEEALLLLSRIDSGTLPLECREVDVFTLLELAAGNLQELFREAGVSVDIPENGSASIRGDLEWTMEAVMNLLKNCMEHTPPGGCVHCSYEQNPLYTQIKIQDEGVGFAKEDLPHIFERFYRGRDAKKDGIGVGLSLAKGIVESQNGTLSAGNRKEGGAYFEIHFYQA